MYVGRYDKHVHVYGWDSLYLRWNEDLRYRHIRIDENSRESPAGGGGNRRMPGQVRYISSRKRSKRKSTKQVE